MIDLAISIGSDSHGTTVIETNCGRRLKAPRWPLDCDMQLVAFSRSGLTCNIVWTELLASDIARALAELRDAGVVSEQKPEWFRRLSRCSAGAAVE